jgi:hypothetical protein
VSVGRVDVRAVGLGGAISAVLAAGLALAGSRSGGGGGPTAASISEGLGEFFGAAVGVLLGGAVTAALARCGSRALTGVLGAMFAYALVLVPAFVATRPSDVTVVDTLAFALAALIVFAPMALVGAALGELLAK